MLSEDLKEQTLQNHQQLEKMLVGKIKSVETAENYITILQLFYSYFGGLEDIIHHFINGKQLPDYNQRRKSAALANDIETLGGVPVAKAQAPDLPQIKSLAGAFGALYVMEGSTLGGGMISKMISARTGLQKGLSFFNGYGDDSMKMWETFKDVLNSQPQSDYGKIISSANDTFSAFGKWVIKSE